MHAARGRRRGSAPLRRCDLHSARSPPGGTGRRGAHPCPSYISLLRRAGSAWLRTLRPVSRRCMTVLYYILWFATNIILQQLSCTLRVCPFRVGVEMGRLGPTICNPERSPTPCGQQFGSYYGLHCFSQAGPAACSALRGRLYGLRSFHSALCAIIACGASKAVPARARPRRQSGGSSLDHNAPHGSPPLQAAEQPPSSLSSIAAVA